MGALNPNYDVRYVENIDPNLIWRWWFTEKSPGFIEQQNSIYDDFFSRLEKSIKNDGFKNPLIVTCGGGNSTDIFRMIHENIEKDPAKADIFNKFMTREALLSTQLFATKDGDGRIYVAKKLGMPIRSFVLDYLGHYKNHHEVTSLEEFMGFFDPVYAKNISNVRFTDTTIEFDIDPWVKTYFEEFKKNTVTKKNTTRFSDLLRKNTMERKNEQSGSH